MESLDQESIYDLQLNSPLDPLDQLELDSPIVEDQHDEEKQLIEEKKQFIENRKKKKELKDAAYKLEMNYLNYFGLAEKSFKKEFPALVNDFSQGELDIEEVKEELEIVYKNKLEKLKDPLVDMTLLRKKTKIHIENLMEEFENL